MARHPLLCTLANYPRNTCGWGLAVTNTLRLASRKLFKYGTNLQNPSARICEIYIPDAGYKFGQVDQAGAEAKVVAYLCRHGNLRDLFISGIKPHVFVAMHVFADLWEKSVLGPIGDSIKPYINCSVPVLNSLPNFRLLNKAIKNSEREYYVGKKLCHSCNYGVGWSTFQDTVMKDSENTVCLSNDEAKYYHGMYHDIFPEIQEWHHRVKQEVLETKMLRNLFGYPRQFTQGLSYAFWKEWYAFVPQSTVATITNIATVEMQQHIEDKKLDWHLLNNKHDSFLCEFPDSVADEHAWVLEARKLIEKDLVAPDGTPFKMGSEAHTGFNWGKYNEEENPNGLREYTLQ